ncbi:unnamed protein product [Allacma fusca]|uniref:Uncharacterized protein n=1 Tax=Allacma fusca TaxID=39272 RepID=A0A8J2K5W2_9HEXA|nr:unnamed protein product [Allacma fusca]
MSRFANIPAEEIVGVRAPFLQGSGDSMYQFLYKNDFVYESSRPTQLMMWPYTADLPSIQECVIPPCPTDLYKGFWVFPMVELEAKDGSKCVMADACDSGPTSADEAYDFLYKNFLNHYGDNRAPFGVYAHATWFKSNPFILEGYCRFVDKILSLGDVYIVSVKKGLDWIRQPTPRTGQLPDSWNDKSREYTCPITYSCGYESADQLPPGFTPRYMTSCSPCPPKYPWTDNPLGEL